MLELGHYLILQGSSRFDWEGQSACLGDMTTVLAQEWEACEELRRLASKLMLAPLLI